MSPMRLIVGVLALLGMAVVVYIFALKPKPEVDQTSERNWYTIADKPAWNEKAQIWEVTFWLGDERYDGQGKKLAICSPRKDDGVIVMCDKGDKVYILHPRTKGTDVFFVGDAKTAKEYDKMFPKKN